MMRKMRLIFLSILLLAIITSPGCKKEKYLVVTTIEVSYGAIYSVVNTGGIIQSVGKSDIIEKGICWSTNGNPSIFDSIVSQGSGNDSFNSTITRLKENTKYFFRAWAKDNSGVVYGNLITFVTKGLFVLGNGITDIDGNHYNSIILGSQEWMAENLKVRHYRNGDSISFITDNSTWGSTTSGAYCYHNNDLMNDSIYGKLYNYYAIEDVRKIAPVGWHIPTLEEWFTLLNYLGGKGVAGGKMKEKGLEHWTTPNIDADNNSFFSALPNGARSKYTGFINLHNGAVWWTTTDYYPNQFIYTINIFNTSAESYILSEIYNTGIGVRCIKD
jgi:uncharacterized protein (TIGR02145 family)